MKNQLIKRKLFSQIIDLLERKEIFALVGPRQVGKTTLMKMIIDYLVEKKHILREKIFYFNFEDPLLQEEFAQDPKEFIRARLSKGRVYFFFDEFHYLKEGGRKLKLIYDLFPQAKIFISGSSSLELTFETARWLVGRILFFRLFPLDFEEFLGWRAKEILPVFREKRQHVWRFIQGKEKQWLKASIFEKRLANLWQELAIFGGYPEVIKAEKEQEKVKILEGIVSTYLQREIRSLLLVEDLAGYQTFLRLLAAQAGDILNFQQLSNDSGLSLFLVKKYLKFLEETFVISQIFPYRRSLSSELRKRPKVYFLDSGLRHFLINNFSPLRLRDDRGKVSEMFVFQQLFKNLSLFSQLHFWRTRGGAEVDFVLIEGERILPLEVKTSALSQPKLTRSLLSFLTKYQPEKAVVFNRNLFQLITKGKTQILFLPFWYA